MGSHATRQATEHPGGPERDRTEMRASSTADVSVAPELHNYAAYDYAVVVAVPSPTGTGRGQAAARATSTVGVLSVVVPHLSPLITRLKANARGAKHDESGRCCEVQSAHGRRGRSDNKPAAQSTSYSYSNIEPYRDNRRQRKGGRTTTSADILRSISRQRGSRVESA